MNAIDPVTVRRALAVGCVGFKIGRDGPFPLVTIAEELGLVIEQLGAGFGGVFKVRAFDNGIEQPASAFDPALGAFVIDPDVPVDLRSLSPATWRLSSMGRRWLGDHRREHDAPEELADVRNVICDVDVELGAALLAECQPVYEEMPGWKESTVGITRFDDLPATARIVTDEAERRELLVHVARSWNRTDVDAMVAWSPLIEVTVGGYSPNA